jgi:hypothetical protein
VTAQVSGSVSLGTWRAGGREGDPLAYVPQTPWIIAGASIAENIVLGGPWDADRLANCIEAAALSEVRSWHKIRNLLRLNRKRDFDFAGGITHAKTLGHSRL